MIEGQQTFLVLIIVAIFAVAQVITKKILIGFILHGLKKKMIKANMKNANFIVVNRKELQT